MNNLEALKKLYRETVIAATDSDVVFIDTTRFTGDKETDYKIFLKQLLEQDDNAPSYSEEEEFDKEISKLDTKIIESFKKITERLKNSGPSVRPFGESCMVTEIDSNYLSKESVLSFYTGHPPEFLKQVPGTIEDYVAEVAKHEAKHCDQQPHKTEVDILARETEADLSSLTSSAPDVSAFLLKVRAFRSDDSIHAGQRLIEHGTHIDALAEQHYGIADTYSVRMDLEILSALDLPSEMENADRLKREDPKLYYDVAETLLVKETFDDDPNTKTYIERHIEAARDLLKLDEMGYKDGIDTEVEIKAAKYLQENGTYSQPRENYAEQTINKLQENTLKDSSGNPVQSGSGHAITIGQP